MDTTKNQVRKAVKKVEDDLNELVCFYQNYEGRPYWFFKKRDNFPPIVKCNFDGLPERKFHSGFGGTEGEPVIAFSDNYVYVKVYYDGAEHVQAVPRHPESIGNNIPWYGGG